MIQHAQCHGHFRILRVCCKLPAAWRPRVTPPHCQCTNVAHIAQGGPETEATHSPGNRPPRPRFPCYRPRFDHDSRPGVKNELKSCPCHPGSKFWFISHTGIYTKSGGGVKTKNSRDLFANPICKHRERGFALGARLVVAKLATVPQFFAPEDMARL